MKINRALVGASCIKWHLGTMVNRLSYKAKDWRFESCQWQILFFFYFFPLLFEFLRPKWYVFDVSCIFQMFENCNACRNYHVKIDMKSNFQFKKHDPKVFQNKGNYWWRSSKSLKQKDKGEKRRKKILGLTGNRTHDLLLMEQNFYHWAIQAQYKETVEVTFKYLG